ncbi:MAG: amino acid permease [Candidatus Brocadiia bacterium]|jgi:amino acid transporter/mannitol/fructose-specific phosphotransferase system IIA component (Ntr-type)|nr:amino acid permease [Candidatus Brocadiia bacterium]
MRLKKDLRLHHVFCIASGAMISSGLFVLPGLAHARAGPAVVVSYFLAGLLALTGMLSQAELVSAMPKAGGTYFYVTRSMGPAVGTVDGLLTWFSLTLKSAFALIGMAAFQQVALGETAPPLSLIAALLCLVFIALNVVGTGGAGRVQVALVVGILVVLVLYVVKGLPAVQVENFEDLAPNGAAAVLSTAGFVFVAYGGLLKVASMAEEVKDPARTVPLGMILSLVVVGAFYMLVVSVTTGVLDRETLDKSLTPISDGAAVFMGPWGAFLLTVAALLAFVSTANAGIMAASRYPMAMSRDGLLPEFLQRVGSRFKTPHYAILVTGTVMIAALFLKLDILVQAASTVLLLTFMFSCLSVVMLRESRVQNYQPRFRAPLYPWVQIVGVLGSLALIIEMGAPALLMALVLVLGGFFFYWFYGRIRSSREYALLHLIERITARELTGRTLETELKEIIRERDEIAKDRFDHVIEASPVLDLEGPVDAETVFRLVAEAMADSVKRQPSELHKLLVEREKQGSTAISPTLAVPHVIVPGEHIFSILLARCRDGIRFSDEAPNVHAVFVLVGSMDERNFHLQALAAIAQIVQDPHFDQRWLRARGEEALRDTVLLGKRLR